MSAKTRAQPLLGTFVEITVEAGDPDSLLSAAFARMREAERIFNFFDPESELSRLNDSAGNGPVACSRPLRDLLGLCAELHAGTGGLFDPSAYLEGEKGAVHGGWSSVQFHELGRVSLAPGTSLNLNGVAKGYIVDLACELLLGLGARAVLVNAGGDLRRAGEGSDPIWVRDPSLDGGLRLWGQLTEGAVATSAGYFAGTPAGCTPYVHPRTGEALPEVPSVTVSAPLCALADALTKFVLLRGADEAVLGRFGASALVI